MAGLFRGRQEEGGTHRRPPRLPTLCCGDASQPAARSGTCPGWACPQRRYCRRRQYAGQGRVGQPGGPVGAVPAESDGAGATAAATDATDATAATAQQRRRCFRRARLLHASISRHIRVWGFRAWGFRARKCRAGSVRVWGSRAGRVRVWGSRVRGSRARGGRGPLWLRGGGGRCKPLYTNSTARLCTEGQRCAGQPCRSSSCTPCD